MARPLRLVFAGALYHITARGERREPIYEDDDDRIGFLGLLGEVSRQHNWVCHAYCLMGNHYHLLVESPDGNLSRGMQQLNGYIPKSTIGGTVGWVMSFRGGTKRSWLKRKATCSVSTSGNPILSLAPLTSG